MLPLQSKVRFAAKVSGFSNTSVKTLPPAGEVFFWGLRGRFARSARFREQPRTPAPFGHY